MYVTGPDRRVHVHGLLLAVWALSLLAPPAMAQTIRVFMSRDGEQGDQPATGNTSIDMTPGETATIGVFLEDTTAGPTPLNAYQLIFHFTATPLAGAEGLVEYVDNNPGQPGGDSMILDIDRPDWVFAGTIPLPISYNETPGIGIYGVFYATIPGTTVDTAGDGIRYLLEFDLTASPDACGQFDFPHNLAPDPPPLSALFNQFGGAVVADPWQVMTINFPACGGGCTDPCDDGDPCTINDACDGDVCAGEAVDCSGQGDECNAASCDPKGAAGNCEVLTPVADDTPCTGGVCVGGVCVECNDAGDCDDGEECTSDACDAGTCSNTPVPDETPCGAGGTCQGGVCTGQGCPEGEVMFLDPPDGVVDARQPHPVDSLSPMQGIDTLTVQAPTGAGDDCWSLCETGNGGLPDNAIADVTEVSGTYTITLARPITPGEVTVISYDGGASFGQFISHPSNANADDAADAMDVLAIIDFLNGTVQPPFGEFSSDINHSNLLAPLDILALVDLLNGADEHDPWNGTALPECGNCCPGGGCEGDPECDDANECTTDTCDLKSGQCNNDAVADGTPCTGGVCTAGVCEGGVECDKPADCDDGEECTTDTCDAGVCGNEPVADGTPCGLGGTCEGGVCAGQMQRRVFMSRDGEQADQPASGNTSIDMAAGEVATIGVFLEETVTEATTLNAYQLIFQWNATPVGTTQGAVAYVDNNEGQPGGDSIFLDVDRPDWVFAGQIVLPISYNETPGIGIFGLFYAIIPGLFVDPAPGILYLVEFEIESTPDACGDFEYRINLAPDPPPLAALFNQFGGAVPVDQWQRMTIHLPACK
jgi:hypothetical protein